MVSNKKYRVNLLAKDFNMKTKDLVDFLAKCGMEGKTSTAVITAEEFSILLDKLTLENQTSQMAAYVAGNAYIPKKVEKAAEDKNTENNALDKKEDRKDMKTSERKEEKKTDRPHTAKAPEAKPAPKADRAPEVKPAPKADRAPDVKPAPKFDKAPEVKPAPKFDRAPEVKSAPKADRAPDVKPAPKFDRAPEARPAAKDDKKFAKPAFATQQEKVAPKPAPKPEVKPEPKAEKRPQTTTVQIKSTLPGGSAPVRSTRIVDTRTTNVNLEKYDERLENFIPESARRNNMTPDRQKMKKQQNSNNPYAKREKGKSPAPKKDDEAKKQPIQIAIPDEITVAELAKLMKVTAAEIVKKLMMMGVMATVNQIIDYDTAYLIADDMGAIVTKEVVVTIEDKLFDETEDKEEDLVTRSPVVCVMGHVDHGKTSLLDAIRHTNVTTGEAGGITQHIGAYRVNLDGQEITFLDTPGHEAFTAMRARGAKATDIAIIVVAADDGIMPQTIEAINHAKAAGVDIIVAINKIDKPTANIEAVMTELTKYDLVPEEWGGDVICVPVSAHTKKGLPDLLESVLMVAELKELKANPNRRAKGIVIEAKLDRGRGPVASILVQNGTLREGETIICGTAVGRVRAMTDERGKNLKKAGPSVPVEITGLDSVPSSGDEFNVVADERMARQLADQRKAKEKEDTFKANAKVNLDELFAQIKEGIKDLNIVVKADVKGSSEAVKSSLEKLTNEEVRVNVIHVGVGGITENDVMLASASNALIVGFNVRPDKSAMDSATAQGVDIRTYRIIYECIEEVSAAIKGMLKPVYRENVIGHASVRQTIHVPNVGTIAGSYITDGKVTRASQIRVVRDGIVIFEDKISSLRRFKDDVREVASGYECGIGLEKFNDIKENDVLEAFIMEEVERN